MKDNSINDRIDRNLGEFFLHRPRLVTKIEDCFHKNNVLVIAAGAGYGKTSAVFDYFSQRQRDIVWMSLTESDNSPALFWSNWFSVAGSYEQDVFDHIKCFSFPDTPQKFDDYWEAIAACAQPREERYFIVDDIHCINNREIVSFWSQSFSRITEYAKLCIISRRQLPWFPEKYELVSEDDLRMTEEEIYNLFALREVRCPADFMQEICRESEGWTFAVNLLSLKLRQYGSSDEYFVRNALIKNVFNYFEQEIFAGLSPEAMRLLHTINVTGRIPLTYFDAGIIDNNSLIRGFLNIDLHQDMVGLHPLIAEYLTAHPLPFTDADLRVEYRKVADWCLQNNQRMLAVKCFSAAADYRQLVANGADEPLFIPRERAGFYRTLIENLTPDETDENYCVVQYIYYPRVLMSLGLFPETEKAINAAIERFSTQDSTLAERILASSYLSLAFLRHYLCPVTHQYDFDRYAALARDHFVKAGITEPVFYGQYNNAPIRTYNCLVGEKPTPGEFQSYLTAVRGMVANIGQFLLGMYAGYDLLCEGEYHFRRNDLARARERINAAINTTRENRQYILLTYALHLSLRICVCEGDADGVTDIIKTYNALLNEEQFFDRTHYCHSFCAWIYIQIGMFKRVPSWMNISSEIRESYEWGQEADDWILSRYYLRCNEPEKVLTMLYLTGSGDSVERTHIGQLDRAVVKALANFQFGRLEDAWSGLRDCYQLSRIEGMTVPLIEFGRDMANLCIGYLKHAAGAGVPATEAIPVSWLEYIRTQSVAYAKKLAYVIGVLFRREEDEVIDITPREKSILVGLYQGLSREEIATSLHISVNTVKTNMTNLFIKTGSQNSLDAVRYGLEKGILK